MEKHCNSRHFLILEVFREENTVNYVRSDGGLKKNDGESKKKRCKIHGRAPAYVGRPLTGIDGFRST